MKYKTSLLKSSILIVLFLGMTSFTTKYAVPSGWFIAGSNPGKYEMTTDTSIFQSGTKSARIESTAKRIKGFGTLMQTCSAKKYLGKKVKMTGYMKSKEVKRWAGFWFRVDGASEKRSLSFDNMRDRPIEGTTEWTKYEIILEVPEKSVTLNYGALIVGTGTIWFDDITFSIVDDAISVTGSLDKPTNTDFEK